MALQEIMSGSQVSHGGARGLRVSTQPVYKVVAQLARCQTAGAERHSRGGFSLFSKAIVEQAEDRVQTGARGTKHSCNT